MTTIRTFTNQPEAAVCLSFLQAYEFDAVLLDGSTYHFAGRAIPIRLQVPQEQAAEALALLESMNDGTNADNSSVDCALNQAPINKRMGKGKCILILGGAVIALIWWLWPGLTDSPSRTQHSNEVYLSHIGDIIVKYEERHGQAPASEDDAFTDLNETLPHRGDYYGRSLGYYRVSNTAFFLKASNCQVYYANGKRVTREEFIEWVRSHPDSGVDGEELLRIYKLDSRN